jgi:dipeptidyl aminopeptidase/acylaminoacyl peptidase
MEAELLFSGSMGRTPISEQQLKYLEGGSEANPTDIVYLFPHDFCDTFSPQHRRSAMKCVKSSIDNILSSATTLIALVPAIVATSLASHGADRHPFGINDYSALHGASPIAVSPDGKTILYEVSTDGMKGPTKRESRLIEVTGNNSRRLDLPEQLQPKGFTRDGSLWGTYNVDKLTQLAIVPLAAAKPTLIIALPNGIDSATISPDGARFALSSDPRTKDPLEGVHDVVENAESGLYVVGVDASGGAWWCPELKFITDIAWSNDSSQIAVMTQSPKIGHHELHSFVNICNAAASRQLAEIPNATSGIAWSADGREIVFASTTTATLTPEHVWTVPVAGGAAVDRTPQLPGTAATVVSDPHGKVWVELHKGVMIEAATFADGQLETAYRWPAGVIQKMVFQRLVASPDILAFSVGDPQHAANVAVAAGSDLRKITNEGDDTLANTDLGDTKVVHWTSKEGIKVEGIATFPAGFSRAKKYPFLVFPHGGPESNDNLEFDVFARVVAGLGYVVLQPEYRGSTGYGADFLSAIYQHFGDRAYRDVDSATDFAIDEGWADPNRLAIFGWSAGGFMTSWTVTQTSRYKAAIEGAGITDWLSFIPTSDTWQTDYDARLQEKDPMPTLQFSAVMHADRVTTPLLILHGAADLRVPTFQGREFYVLLKERGKTARMVTYPGAPHFPQLAEQRRDVLKEICDWLAKYNP